MLVCGVVGTGLSESMLCVPYVEICTECVAQRQCVCESVSLSHCKAMPHRDRQQGHREEEGGGGK